MLENGLLLLLLLELVFVVEFMLPKSANGSRLPGRFPPELGRGSSAVVGVRTGLVDVEVDEERRSPKGSLVGVVAAEALLAAMELRLLLEPGRERRGD